MKVKRMIKSDVDTFKVGDIIKVKLTDGVKVQAMAMQQEENLQWYWLMNKVRESATSFSRVGNDGCADYGNASNSDGVRPAFKIKNR